MCVSGFLVRYPLLSGQCEESDSSLHPVSSKTPPPLRRLDQRNLPAGIQRRVGQALRLRQRACEPRGPQIERPAGVNVRLVIRIDDDLLRPAPAQIGMNGVAVQRKLRYRLHSPVIQRRENAPAPTIGQNVVRRVLLPAPKRLDNGQPAVRLAVFLP